VSARRIAVLTMARSEYGLYRPLLRAICDEPALELQLVIGAAHLDPQYNTVQEIEADGFAAAAHIPAPLEGDGPAAIANIMAKIAAGVAEALDRLKPDMIVVLGDRSEMAAAVLAATPFVIPIAHVAGGATTRGAIDDGFRHAISKLSHLHFPETEIQRQRLLRLGEEPWRIHVTGSLSIDNAVALSPLSETELAKEFGFDLSTQPLLVTLHPETRDFRNTSHHVDILLDALEDERGPIIFTYPGADTSGRIIIARIEEFVSRHREKAYAIPHMGTRGYLSVMRRARAMVGNSSSGIIEAASFKLPVVNIGRRQEGRVAPANVIGCDFDAAEIKTAIGRATSRAFQATLQNLVNPYGQGDAASRMTALLKAVPLNEKLLMKRDF